MTQEKQETRNYDIILIFDTFGKEETLENMISKTEKEMKSCGAKSIKHEQIGRKKLKYNARKLEFGQYVNFYIQAEPKFVEKFKPIAKLNTDIHLSYIQKI